MARYAHGSWNASLNLDPTEQRKQIQIEIQQEKVNDTDSFLIS